MSVARGNGSGRRWVSWAVLVVAGVLLVGSVALVLSGPVRPGSSADGYPGEPVGRAGFGPGNGRLGGGPGGMMGTSQGGGMMSGRVWLAGDGSPVATIAQARARAAAAAAPAGLHPGEVMQFSENFYVELKDAAGAATTEVLVDPTGGAVTTEYGPAMMWNGHGTAAISAEAATATANQWLLTNRPGESVGSTDSYPGYYTMDTVTGGTTVGMVSVNAATGAVWYHTWHGQFIAKEDA